MKKIISFSLFKSNRLNFDVYFNGAKHCQSSYKDFYPDYQSVFYLSDDMTYEGDILKNMGAEIIYMKPCINQGGTMWRFQPLLENNFDIVLFRDVDSFFSKRERVLVELFENSQYDYHIIRDHKQHTHKILAGMWGAKKTDTYLIDTIKNGIDSIYNSANDYTFDETFLANKIYHHIANNVLEHDSNRNPELFLQEPNNFFIGKPYYWK